MDTIQKALFTIGVFALIFDKNNRILLAHRTDMDMWNLPGGGVENLESPWDAVKREVNEETGLTVEIIKLTGIYSKKLKNEYVFCYLCKSISGQLKINSEASELRYFEINQLPKNIIEKHKERILDFVNNNEFIQKHQ